MADTPHHEHTLTAPFPWFGGKRRVAPLLWELLGNVPNYVEPFAGSLACLLGRPHPPGIETINDLDGFVANVWRALALAPEDTARWSDWPVSECDLHARHLWLRDRRDTLSSRLMGDPEYYDAKIAGWWLWGIACWIGSGWCGASSTGPWEVVDGRMVHLGNAGQGVTRQLVHLSNAGQGVTQHSDNLLIWFKNIQSRLRRVRVCCGDWRRVMGPAVTVKNGLTGILLDPPYSAEEDRDMRLYALDSGTVAHEVRDWCLENGDQRQLRIVLCGYGDVHDTLLAHGWRRYAWKATGGYGNQGQGRGRANAHRETLWASPACLRPNNAQLSLFKEAHRD